MTSIATRSNQYLKIETDMMRDVTYKTILITGSTDGIGLATAQMLLEQSHTVLLHGRNQAKLEQVAVQLAPFAKSPASIESYVADLSDLSQVKALAQNIAAKHSSLDVLINNAGVYQVANPTTKSGLDVRFVVNTIAPYLLTRELLPLLAKERGKAEPSRVVNLSSAAQAPVDLDALHGKTKLTDNAAYAQSKLAITMWTRELAHEFGSNGPMVVAVNPASFLGSKMVKEAYGVAGGDLSIGADILTRAALSDEFAQASGKYYDNDSHQFAPPHQDGLNQTKCQATVNAINKIIEQG